MGSTQSKKRILLQNTIMLYILVFSTYFLSFITVPYQTRILGPEYFGKVSFALAFMMYFQLIIDFGFLLSATEDISKNRENTHELSKIVSAVYIIKLWLIILSLVALLILITIFDKFHEDFLLYILTFFSVVTLSLLPDFLYRGLENMKVITYRTLGIRFFFVIMIFIFLKHKSDYYMIPLFTLIGNIGAILGILLHVRYKLNIKFVNVEINYLILTLKKSSFFFYSRIASTVYTATNTFILGILYPTGSNVVGLYTSADKLVNTAKGGFAPIADSLYPYMVKNRDFKLVKKILLIIMPPVVIGSLVICIYAEQVCVLLLGSEFESAGRILRLLMPIVIIAPLTYIMGFPVLSAMNKSNHANISVVVASFFHVGFLIGLFLTDKFSVYSLCIITVITQFILVLYRIVVILKYKDNLIVK